MLENDGRGLNLTWEVRDGIAKHSKGKSGAPVGMAPALRASTIEGQIMRVADLIAYVNHDIDDAMRAGLLRAEDLPRDLVEALGASSSARIGTLVKDVVTETLAGGLTEIRMSEPMLDGVLELRELPVRRGLREHDRDRRVQEGGRHPRPGCGRRSASGRTSSSTRGPIEQRRARRRRPRLRRRA